MTDSALLRRRKLGDLLCDIGKYLLTVLPLTYFMSELEGFIYVLCVTALVGVGFIIYGLYFIGMSSGNAASGTARKRKIRVLRNAVFVVEEEQQP